MPEIPSKTEPSLTIVDLTSEQLIAIQEHFKAGLPRKMGDFDYGLRDIEDPLGNPGIPCHPYEKSFYTENIEAIGNLLISNFSDELVPTIKNVMMRERILEVINEPIASPHNLVIATNHEGWEDIGILLGAIKLALEHLTKEDYGPRLNIVTGYAATQFNNLELPGFGRVDPVAVVLSLANVLKTIPDTDTSKLTGYEALFSQLRSLFKEVFWHRIARGGEIIVVSPSGSDDIKDPFTGQTVMKHASRGTEELFFEDEIAQNAIYLPVLIRANPFRNGIGIRADFKIGPSLRLGNSNLTPAQRCSFVMEEISRKSGLDTSGRRQVIYTA